MVRVVDVAAAVAHQENRAVVLRLIDAFCVGVASVDLAMIGLSVLRRGVSVKLI